MDKLAKQILAQYQCDYNRSIEETFAQSFSEDESVRLFFINENEAFTDGHNIVVDPAVNELFADREALRKTEEFLGWSPLVSTDPWFALRVITRQQNIHECLHILYTDFPGQEVRDPKLDTRNKKRTMSLISNIIEDTYIEAVGSSVYDNIGRYLQFGRVAQLFWKPISKGTIARAFEQDDIPKPPPPEELTPEAAENRRKLLLLSEFLNHMAGLLLYPFADFGAPSSDIAEYVEQTRPLFEAGCVAPSPDGRYAYCSQIFDIILPLIPEDSCEVLEDTLSRNLSGMKTHLSDGNTLSGTERRGRTQNVTSRLFVDLNGNPKEDKDGLEAFLASLREEYAKDKAAALLIVTDQGWNRHFSGKDYDCAFIHKKIKINETRPKVNLNLRKAYQNIYSKYRININSYNSRFSQLLQAQVPTREDGFLFGSGVSSRRLGDPHRRRWFRNMPGIDVPDLAVLLLIDGSGSMSGERQHSAMTSAVIIHEVLQKQGIEHAVVEHRAGGYEPEIDVNILVDFNSRDEEKYNLMLLNAYGDNRDGLALFWAERYINKAVNCENKLIIVIADGYPAHICDDYVPPLSSKDTANAAAKIIRRGTHIIAVALDDPDDYSCYDALKEIYPEVTSCNDLKRLTGQLLTLISRQLS